MRLEYYLKEELYKAQIFCDMDGVLTDFDGDALKKLDPNWLKIYQKDKKEAYDILLDYGPRKFWAEMNWMSDGKKLWNFLKDKNVHLLTAVIRDGGEGKKGKLEWIAKNLGWQYVPVANVVLRSEKKKFAMPNHILIDDRADTIQEWKSAGGIGIVHKSASQTINKLKEIL